ncbi:MAG TPA: hypothetical protein VM691_10435 [Myxococcales bacterium]|nr:hypothetical protein [Myxococcales bacterium]
MRRAKVVVLAVAFAGCAHAGLKKVSDCDQAPVEQRLQCAACTVKNDVPGASDAYEYRPDNDPSNRCVKTN